MSKIFKSIMALVFALMPFETMAQTVNPFIPDYAWCATQGAVVTRNGTGWGCLLPGTSGQVLKTNGAGANVGWQTVSGTGTVTSVGLSLPADFTVSGSPVTVTGTLGATWASVATGNKILASPDSAAGVPTFRSLVANDLPVVTVAKGGTNSSAASGTALDNITGFAGTGLMRRTGVGTYTFGTGVSLAEGGTGGTDAATAKTNLALNNVDNTSDVNKPVSTAQAASIATKVPLAGGTMTGILTLSADPVNALDASTRQYSDTKQGQIQNVSASVAANALTVGWTSPGGVQFRNATLTTGSPVVVNSTSSLSLTVPSGATLGTTSGQAAQLVLIVAYNAGSPALVIGNVAGGNNLDETGLISTTAISAGATSLTAFYSTSTITNSPYRVVGYINISEVTAGTWATAPTLVQGNGGQANTANQSLGMGQTWVDVSGSRAFGTTYWNNTPKPIALIVSPSGSGSALVVSASINGGAAFEFAVTQLPSGTALVSGFLIVPPGMSYNITQVGGTGAIRTWRELR